MTSPQAPDPLETLPEAIIDEEKKGISIIWLLPVVALLVGGWLAYKAFAEKGEEIIISFKTAEGIKEGKTQVKFKDVTVGVVKKVNFSADLSRVLISVTMVKSFDPYMTDKTLFWVVRPRVGATKVSGLETLLSGVYIAIDPSNEGSPTSEFAGLENPPVITTDIKGSRYRLNAEGLGSLSIGSPVYFRQLEVGEVTDYALSEDHMSIDIGIFVEAPYDQFVHEGTRFWNASGVDISMTAAGVQLKLESIVSLLSGGIAFETSLAGEMTPLAKENHSFKLFKDHQASLEQPITQTITFALRFSESVRGLEIGAPVEYRGIRLGTVKAIELGEDALGRNILSPVVIIDFEPQRLASYRTEAGSEKALEGNKALKENPFQRARTDVEKYGLRARLMTGNLMTGKRFVDLDFFPDAPPATITRKGRYPELPTIPGSLEGIVAGMQRILNKLEKADIDETLTNLNRLMVSTSNLMAVLEKDAPRLSKDLHDTLTEARSMLKHATMTLQTATETMTPEGEIGGQMQKALEEISAAARSIRVMAEYLERHPEALIKGKGNF